ncbi:hypothetical protein AMTRI_Chr04g243270 [Amborella trichopoda]
MTADFIGVVSIALKLEFDNTTCTSNKKHKSWDNSTLHMYPDGCNDGYPKAIEDLQATMDDYKSAFGYPMDCEVDITSTLIYLAPLSNMNLYLSRLFRVVLSLLQLLA